MKKQAVKCSEPHVKLHIKRQRALGEKMVGEHDMPRPIEMLVVTAVVLLALFFAAHRGWI